MPDPRQRSAPVPRWLGAVLSPIYRAAINRRNARFDQGIGVQSLGLPVVSVGNLSVGGTGKTPMVQHLARTALVHNLKPLIAMRGYSRNHQPSDEADEYARTLPNVPIVAQPDRARGIRAALADRHARDLPPIDLVILDDGFQHRQIARDLDIVLIDALRPPTLDRLLPAGWLREPISALARASLVVLTRADQLAPDELRKVLIDIENAGPNRRPVDVVVRQLWTALRAPGRAGEADIPLGLEALIAKRVVASCAIGNSAAFLRSLATTIGQPPVAELTLPDHDPYAPSTVTRLINLARAERAEAIVVTEKDWSKLRHVDHDRWPCPIFRPVLELGIDRGQATLHRCLLDLVRRS